MEDALGFPKDQDQGIFEDMFNIREYLSTALHERKARNWGAGCGFGAFDTGGDLCGTHYEVTIREVPVTDLPKDIVGDQLEELQDASTYSFLCRELLAAVTRDKWEVVSCTVMGNINSEEFMDDGMQDIYLHKNGHYCNVTIGEDSAENDGEGP